LTDITSDLKNSESIIHSNLKIGYWIAVVAFILGIAFLAAVAASFIALKGPPTGVYLMLVSLFTLFGAVAMLGYVN
jgi:hypothetical protein